MFVTCSNRHIVTLTGQVAFTSKVTNFAHQEMLVEKLRLKRPGFKYTDLLTYLLTYLIACLLPYLRTLLTYLVSTYVLAYLLSFLLA